MGELGWVQVTEWFMESVSMEKKHGLTNSVVRFWRLPQSLRIDLSLLPKKGRWFALASRAFFTEFAQGD
jgi:hypothetical protein